MGRVQIGKKQRVEVSDYDESTKQIAKKVLREIVNEGFNGADVLPGVWVIEKTLRNHIVAEQPNIAPEISINEVNELAETILESVKAQTIKGDEKVKSTEDYENSQNFPKELPTIKMGNVSVVKFPEGGQDAERSIKVDGYRKVGRFYRPKLDVEELKLRKSRNKKARKELIFEQKENLRRIKLRRGLLKPVTTKSTLGKPINLVKSPEGLLPMPIPQFDLDTRKINILDNEKTRDDTRADSMYSSFMASKPIKDGLLRIAAIQLACNEASALVTRRRPAQVVVVALLRVFVECAGRIPDCVDSLPIRELNEAFRFLVGKSGLGKSTPFKVGGGQAGIVGGKFITSEVKSMWRRWIPDVAALDLSWLDEIDDKESEKLMLLPDMKELINGSDNLLTESSSVTEYKTIADLGKHLFAALRTDRVDRIRYTVLSWILRGGETLANAAKEAKVSDEILEAIAKSRDEPLYTQVKCLGMCFDKENGDLFHRFRLPPAFTRKVAWQGSRRLTVGTLVAVSWNSFNDIVWGAVAHRDPNDFDTKGILDLKLFDGLTQTAFEGLMGCSNVVICEAPCRPDAPLPVDDFRILSHLQLLAKRTASHEQFPFQSKIIGKSSSNDLPGYIDASDLDYDFDKNLFPVDKPLNLLLANRSRP